MIIQTNELDIESTIILIRMFTYNLIELHAYVTLYVEDTLL